MSDDALRERRGKQGGMYVEVATGDPVIATQYIEDGVALWVVNPITAEPFTVSSDDFAAQYATPKG